jgi:hypothetical protein
MKTATGYQDRQAKSGDKEYETWLIDKAAYEKESYQLRVAAGAVSALKDIDWSQYDLSNPPPVAGAIEMYKVWPENILLRKKAWLDWTILFKRSDQNAILEAMNIMNGESGEPTEEMIDEVKKNSALLLELNQRVEEIEQQATATL